MISRFDYFFDSFMLLNMERPQGASGFESFTDRAMSYM